MGLDESRNLIFLGRLKTICEAAFLPQARVKINWFESTLVSNNHLPSRKLQDATPNYFQKDKVVNRLSQKTYTPHIVSK